MAYWLMKSEPHVYSWDDLVRDGATDWDGVRNNAARLHLRAMKPGDEAFFYHSGEERAVVGIMRIAGAGKPDGEDGAWVKVPVEPVRTLAAPSRSRRSRPSRSSPRWSWSASRASPSRRCATRNGRRSWRWPMLKTMLLILALAAPAAPGAVARLAADARRLRPGADRHDPGPSLPGPVDPARGRCARG